MTMPRTVAIERAGFVLITACLGLVQFHLMTAQALFGLASICWLVLMLEDRKAPRFSPGAATVGVRSTSAALPRFALPLGLYAAWTLLSAVMSAQPARSIIDSKQLLLFLMVPIVARFARGRRAITTIDVIMALGAAGALIGVVQYALLGFDHLNERPTGLLSHYMTFSGVLMLVTCAATARLLFYTGQRVWPAVAMPALLAALALTLTQNAWIGTIVALGCLIAVRQLKLLLLAPIVLVLVFAIAPGQVRSRVMNGFSPQTESNRDRIQMLAMGQDMVRDHPLFGVGPEMVGDVYGRYLRPNPVHTYNPHLHNVPMQIAAERGLPALGLFLWFIVATLLDAWRQLRDGPHRAVAGAAVGAVVAMMTAGLFEYNFGDSEFLMLFLGIITLPFAARQTGEADLDGRLLPTSELPLQSLSASVPAE